MIQLKNDLDFSGESLQSVFYLQELMRREDNKKSKLRVKQDEYNSSHLWVSNLITSMYKHSFFHFSSCMSKQRLTHKLRHFKTNSILSSQIEEEEEYSRRDTGEQFSLVIEGTVGRVY